MDDLLITVSQLMYHLADDVLQEILRQAFNAAEAR
jgi:hypothetical protein